MKMDNKRAAFVPAAIAKKIATIELRARRLGWPAELLFDPTLDDYGRPLGLAATLDPSDAIVAVRRDCIVVRKNRLTCSSFLGVSSLGSRMKKEREAKHCNAAQNYNCNSDPRRKRHCAVGLHNQ
jgi:hypothetical protein